MAFCIRCTRGVPRSLSNSVCIDVHIYLSQRARGLAIACNKNIGQRPRFTDVVCSSCIAVNVTTDYAIGSVQKGLSATGLKCIRGQVHNACVRLNTQSRACNIPWIHPWQPQWQQQHHRGRLPGRPTVAWYSQPAIANDLLQIMTDIKSTFDRLGDHYWRSMVS